MTQIKHIKEYLESTRPQFVISENGGHGDDFCGHTYAKRIKDGKKFFHGNKSVFSIGIASRYINKHLKSNTFIDIHISDFCEDCIHIILDPKIVLYEINSNEKPLRYLPYVKVEINKYEEAIEKLRMESLMIINDYEKRKM